jgi:hypothetical protein
VARTAAALNDLAGTSPNIRTEVADATDADAAGRLIGRYRPHTVVLVAGASPTIAALQDQTWETFSVNWHTDVQVAFHWLHEAVRRPLRPGSRVVVISSGAAVAGSPLSGGLRRRQGDPAFHHGLRPGRGRPRRSGHRLHRRAATDHAADDLGRPLVQAYAARRGQTEEEYARQLGALLTPQAAGAAVAGLVEADAATLAPAYLLTGAGLQRLP